MLDSLKSLQPTSPTKSINLSIFFFAMPLLSLELSTFITIISLDI